MKVYYSQICDIVSTAGIPEPQDIFATLLRMPDVMTTTDLEVLTDGEWAVARNGIEMALQQLVDFRCQEGAALQRKFTEKIDNIQQLMSEI